MNCFELICLSMVAILCQCASNETMAIRGRGTRHHGAAMVMKELLAARQKGRGRKDAAARWTSAIDTCGWRGRKDAAERTRQKGRGSAMDKARWTSAMDKRDGQARWTSAMDTCGWRGCLHVDTMRAFSLLSLWSPFCSGLIAREASRACFSPHA